ncbi:MAG: hypothetical protein PWP04_1564 [Candidatus Atribacteria bacterium]|nr:hypothetical protein [Candidatus Atribacteria bacterium]
MLRGMKKYLNVILIIVVIAFAATIYYGYGSYSASSSSQTVAAMVNGTPITINQLNSAFRNTIANYDTQTLNQLDETTISFLRLLTLENLINNELLYQEAQSRRIGVSDREIEAEIEAIQAQFPSPEEFQRFLDYQQIRLRDLRESIKRSLMIEKLIDSLGESIVIPEEDIQRYYQENLELFTIPPQYHLKQITLPSKEEAENIHRHLLLGEDFSQVAREHSIDSFADQGGERGWVGESSLPEAAKSVLSTLPREGTAISPIVQIGEQYVIYQVLEYQPEKKQSYEEVKEQIEQTLRAEQERVKVEHLLAELREKSEITISEELQLVTTSQEEESPSSEETVPPEQ